MLQIISNSFLLFLLDLIRIGHPRYRLQSLCLGGRLLLFLIVVKSNVGSFSRKGHIYVEKSVLLENGVSLSSGVPK